jgi:DNA gyrase/topoisomerase IV subunit B
MGKDFDLAGFRYGKVILLMDADVDGHHISTLLIGFFYMYMPQLIAAGKLYLAMPPLYRVNVGKETHWVVDDVELEDLMESLGKKAAMAEVAYFKGLGEMNPDTLYETTMDPVTRKLVQLTIPDGEELSTAITLHDLLGKDSDARTPYIEHHCVSPKDISV